MENCTEDLCEGVCVQVDVPNSEAAVNLLRALSETNDDFKVNSVIDHTGEEMTVPVPLGSITEKQREAVILAIENGYYDQPRRVELADLADELGVSTSAVSQRLSTVERKLVRLTFDRFV